MTAYTKDMDVDLTEDAIKAVVPAGQDSVINALRKLKNPKVNMHILSDLTRTYCSTANIVHTQEVTARSDSVVIYQQFCLCVRATASSYTVVINDSSTVLAATLWHDVMLLLRTSA
jgi:hypothetical protein